MSHMITHLPIKTHIIRFAVKLSRKPLICDLISLELVHHKQDSYAQIRKLRVFKMAKIAR